MRRDSERGGGDTASYGQASYGSPYGRPPAGDSGWGDPPPRVARDEPPVDRSYAPPPPPVAGPPRGRPGLIVLFALLVQLVIVGAAGNQWVADKIRDRAFDDNDLLAQGARMLYAISWRATPVRDSFTRFEIAAWVGLGVAFVVSALLTLALVRGPITFWRAAIGVFTATVVGSVLGGIAGRLVPEDQGQYEVYGGKVAGAILTANGYLIADGIVIGVVAGLVAALIAVATRRPGAVLAPVDTAPANGPYADPEAPEPWYGEAAGAQPGGGSPSLRKVQDSVGRPDERPAERPEDRPVDDPGWRRTATGGLAGGAAGAGAATAATTAFPAVGRDEQYRPPDEPPPPAAPAEPSAQSGAAAATEPVGERRDPDATGAMPLAERQEPGVPARRDEPPAPTAQEEPAPLPEPVAERREPEPTEAMPAVAEPLPSTPAATPPPAMSEPPVMSEPPATDPGSRVPDPAPAAEPLPVEPDRAPTETDVVPPHPDAAPLSQPDVAPPTSAPDVGPPTSEPDFPQPAAAPDVPGGSDVPPDGATRQLPRLDPDEPRSFPRPPDDEDLGHTPDDDHR